MNILMLTSYLLPIMAIANLWWIISVNPDNPGD